MSYNYRCTDRRGCGARITFKKRIEEYVKPKLCPGCGRDKLKPVGEKERKRNRKRKCTCDGFIFPHSIGSPPWCIHSEVMPTEEDHEYRHQELLNHSKHY